jgi:prevent-host-death family protein
MAEVTIRELRNRGGDVVDRVERGERLTVTRDGRPVAELSPVGRPALDATTLLRRWARLPQVDPQRLRADIDESLDQSL